MTLSATSIKKRPNEIMKALSRPDTESSIPFSGQVHANDAQTVLGGGCGRVESH